MSREKDTIYYHYTSVQACHSILTRKSVWLTDYRFLNDEQELNSAINLLGQYCSAEQKAALLAAMHWNNFSHFQCILSLSRSPKILSQWRAYGADGRGMALGLRGWALKKVGFELVECKYDNHKEYASEVYKQHQPFLDELTRTYKELAANNFMSWVTGRQEEMGRIIRDLVPIKNGAFSEEQEVRALVSVPYQEIQLRARGDLLVPYIERSLVPSDDTWPLSIIFGEVWLGPKCDDRNRTGLWAAFKDIHKVERYDCGYV